MVNPFSDEELEKLRKSFAGITRPNPDNSDLRFMATIEALQRKLKEAQRVEDASAEEHRQEDRTSTADNLRQMADLIEEGKVEAIWMVATSATQDPLRGTMMALMGPSPDNIAIARLFLYAERMRHLLLQSLNGDLSLRVMGDKKKPDTAEESR